MSNVSQEIIFIQWVRLQGSDKINCKIVINCSLKLLYIYPSINDVYRFPMSFLSISIQQIHFAQVSQTVAQGCFAVKSCLLMLHCCCHTRHRGCGACLPGVSTSAEALGSHQLLSHYQPCSLLRQTSSPAEYGLST